MFLENPNVAGENSHQLIQRTQGSTFQMILVDKKGVRTEIKRTDYFVYDIEQFEVEVDTV